MEIHPRSPPQRSATLYPRNTVCKASWSPDRTAESFPLHGSTFMAVRVESSTFLQQRKRWTFHAYAYKAQMMMMQLCLEILLLPVRIDTHFISSSTFTPKITGMQQIIGQRGCNLKIPVSNTEQKEASKNSIQSPAANLYSPIISSNLLHFV